MSHKYPSYEREILRQMLFSISSEAKPFIHPEKDPNILAGIIFRKMEWALLKFDEHKNRKIFALLDKVIPEKRGKEECDCRKGEHMCGCRVNDFNDCKEQVEFSINLIKTKISNNEF